MLSLAFAGAVALAQSTVDCDSPMTTADMIRCETEEIEVLEIDMTAMLHIAGEALKKLGGYEQLIQSQRAWLNYRDAQCASEGLSARGGSMEPVLIGACKRELTKARTQQLSDLFGLLDD
jgi:uncharacterized protein YecT (DUF1311 family)